MKADILICSVGGQEIRPYLDFFSLFADKIGEHIYIDYKKGFSPERCSESYSVRIGGGFGEILSEGADVVIATEQLEGLKNRFFPSSDGGLIVSKKRILPASVINGTSGYPSDCFQKCINDCFKVFDYDEDYLTACFLALRLIGIDKDKCLSMFQTDYKEAVEIIEKAFARKFVKA